MKIVIAPLAAQDLGEAYAHISKDNSAAADRVLASLSETIGLLASGVVRGREVVLRTGERLLSWAHPPYRIYYRLLNRLGLGRGFEGTVLRTTCRSSNDAPFVV